MLINKRLLSFFVCATTVLWCTDAPAQSKAAAQRKDYNFGKALEICASALADTTLEVSVREAFEEEQMLSDNASKMMEYCAKPSVVAKYRFSKEDFFLFYPMQDRSWRALPNKLDTLNASGFVRAIFVPADATTIYYSAPDENGVRNLYRTDKGDSLWTAPQLINEQLTSSSDEIYPVLSADKKTLYFASRGLYGMGGYDLYYSTWDDSARDWGTPLNMGFPFSSPFDDFLFMNTEDGHYSIFASNRECSADSVCLYVLEADSMPLRKAITEPAELKTLCTLTPAADPTRMDNNSAMADKTPVSEDMKHYVELIGKVKALRDSVYAENDIQLLVALQTRLSDTTKELQEIELNFLMSGIVIDPEKLAEEAEKEVVGATSGYTFTKNNLGKALEMDIEVPEPVFDYSFKVMEEGQFAEDNTLPEGLIYQIQLFAISRKAEVKQLHGLSPVFERTSNGRYIYSAGLFKTYKDVLANLNTVKRQGFKNAMIVAYLDGKTISIKNARAKESQIVTQYVLKIYPADGKALTDAELSVIHQMTDKDIIKLLDKGAVMFEVGPLESQEEADKIATALRAAGASSISVGAQEEEQ